MRILAVYNLKGGVGKTATAVNLAHLAAEEGRRVLIWDLDPQGAASFYFRIRPEIKGGSEALVGRRRTLAEVVKGTDFAGLDLLPADFSYRNLDLTLKSTDKPTKQLLKLLRPLAASYDLVILDCPPSISSMSENVFRAADVLLVPLIPTVLCERTFSQLLGFLSTHRPDSAPRLAPFFAMVDRRHTQHRQILAELPTRHPQFLTTAIPYSAEVERMGVHRLPLAAFAPRTPAALAYRKLWAEVQRLL